jgi:hypothetical protein
MRGTWAFFVISEDEYPPPPIGGGSLPPRHRSSESAAPDGVGGPRCRVRTGDRRYWRSAEGNGDGRAEVLLGEAVVGTSLS